MGKETVRGLDGVVARGLAWAPAKQQLRGDPSVSPTTRSYYDQRTARRITGARSDPLLSIIIIIIITSGDGCDDDFPRYTRSWGSAKLLLLRSMNMECPDGHSVPVGLKK